MKYFAFLFQLFKQVCIDFNGTFKRKWEFKIKLKQDENQFYVPGFGYCVPPFINISIPRKKMEVGGGIKTTNCVI